MAADTPRDSREPRTEAGKALARRLDPDGQSNYATLYRGIAAIEEQAAAEARRELLAKVEGIVDGLATGTHARHDQCYVTDLRRLIEESR